jgi:2-dehydropantoate 2-reductase
LGVTLPYADPVLAVEAVAGRTANNFSSMLRDIQRDAPTEIDSINGAIVRAGERVGVPTPVNRTLWHLIKAIEISADGKAQTISPKIPAGRKVKKIRQPLSRKSAYLASLK